ncbi:MAG: 5-(carboxyamino)imidazole ribonucleotide mutase [Campylobacteraceae bacterium]|uniref:5-(carboxyamino)imidazole ribonucleotide mutase n=1 Tax=Campylobacter sp. TaxID=205 RepID=UPI00297B1BF8|nr:5-(carboxyamino)imidazole ribonucleotide mutase [Campylobacter sp.]MDD6161640.1 5-(carboxyamino)imidazole ribonucleotide mutase [Campylobacteraceae bacterium]MCI7076772.1 5-(carboxyamino)imidazole ribonucleotide mutase [Campylobacter sp.]MDD7741322.1 5-(carboxyamino)imidazole ribonucleotide mutase [Campylobacteraceae bacterium]MDY3245745.1 5-(carboxyamino)imidazole ribonucleotide mutase [Campylobacter sp.]MDY4121289.1 5-(carboxyamino)imidazole ribonucleotide mutase [Campylobacter sp.]
MKFVSIIIGSKSDYEIANECSKILSNFDVPFELIISSAHRSPERTHEYVKDASERGAQIFICMAGMAAHLAGAVAAMTTKPVIGVPMPGSAIDGIDALYSTVQMPGGIPVATVAIGKAGAKNAAYLALQILALNNESIASKLTDDRAKQSEALIEDSKKIEVLIKEKA